MKHKVLIITYYWPPSGGSAVLRWLKFTKYLRKFGWEPVIYTPENPEPQEIDESLLNDIPENLEVLKMRIIEPYSIYKWLTGKKQSDRMGVALMNDKKKAGLIGKISLWIRSNLFIPDPRMLWIRPSVNALSHYLKTNPVDVIITTGPPHSMHLIGMKLKRKLGIKWVADFRDPWTNIDFYQDLPLIRFADYRHRKLELEVLKHADRIVTVSPGMTNDFKAMGIDNVTTITNGYDLERDNACDSKRDKFILLHLGSLPKSRNPEILWQALSEMVNHHKELASKLQVKLIGKADKVVWDSISAHHLDEYLSHEPFVPHDQTFGILSHASALLLCINNAPNAKGILTNKFFEYLSAKRPIIALGPADGDVSFILKETGAGEIFNYSDSDALQEHLLNLFNLFAQDKLEVNINHIDKYSRENLTQQLSELLNTTLQ